VPVLAVPADAVYVEPFVGGANVMAAVVAARRIGADAHPYLIALHRAIAAGWVPPAGIDRDTFEAVRDNLAFFPAHVVGFVGFGASLQGAFFRGFDRGTVDPKKPEYLVDRAAGLSKVLQAAHAGPLRGVEWRHSNYDQLDIPDGAYVYCDPPYAGTAGYSTGTFDHVAFWRWASALRGRCTVRVSEFSAPDGWRCVWEQERPLMGSGAARRTKIERLFA
jgi:DNA adenine methylase